MAAAQLTLLVYPVCLMPITFNYNSLRCSGAKLRSWLGLLFLYFAVLFSGAFLAPHGGRCCCCSPSAGSLSFTLSPAPAMTALCALSSQHNPTPSTRPSPVPLIAVSSSLMPLHHLLPLNNGTSAHRFTLTGQETLRVREEPADTC